MSNLPIFSSLPKNKFPCDSTGSREDTNSDSYPGENDTYNLTTPTTQKKDKKLYSPSPSILSATKSQKIVSSPPFHYDVINNTYDSTDVTHSCIATESITNHIYTNLSMEHLDLANFKAKPCPINSQHNHKHCPYYHNYKDRKRPGNFYSSDLCEYAEKDTMTCPNGDNCFKAHNRVEQLYKPDKYKTKFCTFYPNNIQSCDYGSFCSFAHSENDITIELIHNYEYDDDFYMFHFKTVWCPFNLTQHDKALCVYAHNWQDYRRKPHIYNYDPTPCPNWKSTDFILNYEDGCPLKEKCSKCHGWKENEYHPLNYKSKPCTSGKACQKGKDCAHYHSQSDRRALSTNISNKIFRFVPRNRIITGTFKRRPDDKYQSLNTSYGTGTPTMSQAVPLVDGYFPKNMPNKRSYLDILPSKEKNQSTQHSQFSPLSLASLFQYNKSRQNLMQQATADYIQKIDKDIQLDPKNENKQDEDCSSNNGIDDSTTNSQSSVIISNAQDIEIDTNGVKKINRERSMSEFSPLNEPIHQDNMNPPGLEPSNGYFVRKWSNGDSTTMGQYGLGNLDQQYLGVMKSNKNDKPRLRLSKAFIPHGKLSQESCIDNTVKANVEKLFEDENDQET